MKVVLLLLAISSLLTASDKAPAGEIINPSALGTVRSFCVDVRDLSGFDRHMVKDFLKAESKPKHLLTKLPWTLVPECAEGASDVAAKVEFIRDSSIRIGSPPITPEQNLDHPYVTRAALKVVDASSQELLYKVEAGAVMNAEGPADTSSSSAASDNTNPVIEQREALYHAFWALVDDVRHLQQTHSH